MEAEDVWWRSCILFTVLRSRRKEWEGRGEEGRRGEEGNRSLVIHMVLSGESVKRPEVVADGHRESIHNMYLRYLLSAPVWPFIEYVNSPAVKPASRPFMVQKTVGFFAGAGTLHIVHFQANCNFNHLQYFARNLFLFSFLFINPSYSRQNTISCWKIPNAI